MQNQNTAPEYVNVRYEIIYGTAVWNDAAHTTANCIIRSPLVPGEDLPFTASPLDPEPAGVDVWNRLLAGEAGEIAEYVPPEG